jgi:TatD DNase family protein
MHDAHCHPFDLARKIDLVRKPVSKIPEATDTAEAARRTLNIPCMASAWGKDDFTYNEFLSKNVKNTAAPVFLSFGVHPQLLAADKTGAATSLAMFETLVRESRLNAVGEIGFDLFDERYRSTEKEQDTVFCDQLALATHYNLPVIIHARKAIHKIFAYKKALKQIKAVVFHAFSGTDGEAMSLLAYGINACFSFGTAILNNHKKAQKAVALIPAERLLFETDAPYQPLRGNTHSHYRDLAPILEKAASLRREADADYADRHALETLTDTQFYQLFKK